MNKKDLDASADISFTEDDPGLDRSMGLDEVTGKSEIQSEPWREGSQGHQASKGPTEADLLKSNGTPIDANLDGSSPNHTDPSEGDTKISNQSADILASKQQAQELDSGFKKVKDQAATKPTTQPTHQELRHVKLPQKDQLQSIEEESRSNVSNSYQSIVLDQSTVHTDPNVEKGPQVEAERTLGTTEAGGDLTEQQIPKDVDESQLNETYKGYRPELDFGVSIDQRDQLESSMVASSAGVYGNILNPQVLGEDQPNELSHIVETLKSSEEMIQMDQVLSSLPESKEVAEEFPPLRHLLEHQEYNHTAQNFAIGDESVLLISQSKSQIHVHHIESRHKPFVLFNNKSAKVSEVHLVKSVLPKVSVALISFEWEGRHFVAGKGVDEDNFAGFDCRFVYETPSRPSLFRSKLNRAGFAFKRNKSHNEEPRVVLLDFQTEQFRSWLAQGGFPQSLVVPAVVDLAQQNPLDLVTDLAISYEGGLCLAVAPYRSHDPSFGGRIIAFDPAGQSREFSIMGYKETQEEGEGVIMVEFLQKKFASCSEECFLAVEDSEGYIFSIKNRHVPNFKADLIQRFSIISGLTGPNSQPLQRSEVFFSGSNLIVFRSSAYWMLVFKLDEEVNSSGVGSAQVVGQARFRTNLAYCGYSIHQTSSKQAICVGKAFPEHKRNYLIQNLVGLSRADIYKPPTLISLQEPAIVPETINPEAAEDLTAHVDTACSEAKLEEHESTHPIISPNLDPHHTEPRELPQAEIASSAFLEAGLTMTGDQFFDIMKNEPLFGIPAPVPEPPEELSKKESKEAAEDGQVETKSMSASDMMKELIWGSDGNDGSKQVQNPDPAEPNERIMEGSRHVAQVSNISSVPKKPHDASTSQGKHQNSRRTEDQKATHKSKESIPKSGGYTAKTSSGNGVYKPKVESTTGSSQQAYIPVNQTKVSQPAPTKTSSAKQKLTPADEKDSKDKDFKGGKHRSKTPVTKNFGPRGTSSSSEEKYEPKHPQQSSQISPNQQDGLYSFAAKLEQKHPGHSAQTNGSQAATKAEAVTISTPAFKTADSTDIAQLRRLALGEDSGLEEGAARTIERTLIKVLDSMQHQSQGQSRSNLPDNFENRIAEIFERVCEDKLINSMKTKFECMLSNSFNETFEELMIPIFEKYLSKVFDKTGQILEKGLRFYSDKINIEERKVSQFKEQFNQMTTQFLTHSKSFNKLCQDMSQTKKDLETGQSKELSKRVSAIEESVEKMKEKQDTMLEILMRLDQRSKQQEEDKKAEQIAAATPPHVSAPAAQPTSSLASQQAQLQLEGQALASSLLQRPGDSQSQLNNQQLAQMLLSSLSHPASTQRPQQAPTSVHTLLPGLPAGQNALSAPHYAAFAPNQSFGQHQTLQPNMLSMQALQQLMQQRSPGQGQPIGLGNSGIYNPQAPQGLDGSILLPGGGQIFSDGRQMHSSSQAVADAEMLDRIVRLAQQPR